MPLCRVKLCRSRPRRLARYKCVTDPSPKRKRGVSTPVARAPGSAGCGILAECTPWVSPSAHVLPSQRRPRSAFSLTETVLSMGLVSGLLVVALSTVGNTTVGRQQISASGRGHLLAQDLMAEILQQEYEDPDGTAIFGVDAVDEDIDPRTEFDDVDDYHGWDRSPLEYKDGTPFADLDAWRRAVTVEYVNPSNLDVVELTDQGVKRISVTVSYNDKVEAALVAIRTVGLPPPDDTLTVLFVAIDAASLTSQETARVTLIESWGFTASLISAADSVGTFSTALADADVAYVSEQIDTSVLGTKLLGATIGVINEDIELLDDFQFGPEDFFSRDRDEIDVLDNTHYITSSFNTGLLKICSSIQPVHMLQDDSVAPGLQMLAKTFNWAGKYRTSLAVVEAGAQLYDGSSAADRRVHLPWGDDSFDFNALNPNGQTIMKRAIEWAASREEAGASTCNDGTCDAGEDSCSCPADCGVPPVGETPDVTCTDGIDNDCDGVSDCNDADCGTDPACPPMAPVCGDGACDPGEDCNSCSLDCDSKTNGPASGRYCCGNGVLESAEGDGTICDGNP